MRNKCLAVASPAEKFCKIKDRIGQDGNLFMNIAKECHGRHKLQWAPE